MVDAADCPDDGVGKAGERPFDSPRTGSAFDDGQSPLGGFFFGPQPPCSPFAVEVSSLASADPIGIVNVDEVDELEEDDNEVATEDEEFIL